jgi:chromosome partitioning protein
LIAVANQKGGVGKTTTAVNLAVGLSLLNSGLEACNTHGPILLVDLDPQGNATSGLNPPPQLSAIRNSGKTVYQVITGQVQIAEAIRPVRENIRILPSSADLVGAEVELATVEGRERRLKDVLAPLAAHYSFILIDTPPSLGLLTLNAMVAADSIIVPMQCEYYALEGLSALLGTIGKVRKVLNPGLQIDGIVLTMFDARNRLSHEIARDVNRHFPDKLFQSVIPRNVRLSESPSHGLSVIEYDAKSAGADAYRALAAEVLHRGGGTSAIERSGTPERSDDRLESPAHPGRKSWNLRALFARDGERRK